MSELAIIATVCALMIPITSLINGLALKGMMNRALDHLEETQVVGGTPKEVFERRADLEAERRKANLDARKPKPVGRTGVVS